MIHGNLGDLLPHPDEWLAELEKEKLERKKRDQEWKSAR